MELAMKVASMSVPRLTTRPSASITLSGFTSENQIRPFLAKPSCFFLYDFPKSCYPEPFSAKTAAVGRVRGMAWLTTWRFGGRTRGARS